MPTDKGSRQFRVHRDVAYLTASAAKVDLKQRKEIDNLRRRLQGWQKEAWAYTRQIPEVSYAHNYVANACKRVRLYVGTQIEDDEDPAALNDDLVTEQKLDPAMCARAQEELQRMDDHTDGGIAELQYAMGYNASVAGEYHVLVADADSDNEAWDVLSTSEILIRGDDVFRKRSPMDTVGELISGPGNDLFRVWRRDPEFAELATSQMVGVLSECDELLALGRQFRNLIRSHIPAGFFLAPNEMDITSAEADDEPRFAAGEESGGEASLLEKYMQMMSTPIFDETSMSGVVPPLLQADAEVLNAVRFLPIDRPLDVQLITRHDVVLRRVANGLDLPAAVILGTDQGVNHWNAWLIDEDAFKAHLEPLVVLIHSGLWSGWIRPILLSEGFDADEVNKITLWHDASGLVSHPDRFQNAVQAYDIFEASGDAVRKYGGLTEEDAPDKDELVSRMGRLLAQHVRLTDQADPLELVRVLLMIGAAQAEGDQTVITDAANPDQKGDAIALPAPQPVAPGPGGTVSPGRTPPAPPARSGPTTVKPGPPAPPSSGGRAIAASGRLHNPGMVFGQVDRALRARLVGEANGAMRRALERAGAKVRSRARNGRFAEQVRDEAITNDWVVARLGPAGLKALGFADTELLDEASFEQFGTTFHQLVARQQAQVRAMLADLGYDGEDLTPAQDYARDLGWTVLSGALVALGRDLLYNPSPSAPPQGEFDASSLVQPGLVGLGLAITGGDTSASLNASGGVVSGDGGAPDGLATGPTVQGALTELQLGFTDRTWVHGATDRPFPPHADDLDGQSFFGTDDPDLANDSDWPDTEFYYPLDHDGCTCSWDYTVGDVSDQTADQPEAAPMDVGVGIEDVA